MREIKFRFWNKQHNRWTLENNFVFLDYPEKYIPLQYTGLKDKNGKEVYEGDVVLDSDRGQKKRAKGFIEYQAYQFVIRKLPKSNRKTWYEMWGCCVGEEGKHLEIIGNIYENPELLK